MQHKVIIHRAYSKIISDLQQKNESLCQGYHFKINITSRKYKCLRNIIDTLSSSSMNLFGPNIDNQNLFNLIAASQDVADLFLNIFNHGNKQKEKFIQNCTTNGTQFGKPIYRVAAVPKCINH